ncbi:RNA degradosome polyphosphate kinase [Trueperella pyogenes]|uniref:RNA degradosome polyphosphate kinase n=1 Tax=Trueperella pyogenes TaxID=1661 RepID=UPI0024C07E75|nr:RNA degradosome polyphosphate kinase [Trueperella pyogenes]WHU60757.1 RNA degradosome polyphosphate kinase [Trueperella pyogenes]
MSDEYFDEDSALVESTPSDHLDLGDDIPESTLEELLDEDEEIGDLTSQEMASLRARVQEMRLGASVSTAALVEEAESLVRAAEAREESQGAAEGEHSGTVAGTSPAGTLPEGRFLDRELSWLAFNERVLEQAEDLELPVLERTWFLAIFASNLDEFYMVRVAGLMRRIATGMAVTKASGLTPRQTLEGITVRTKELQERHARVFADDVQPKLAEVGIVIQHWSDLGQTEKDRLSKFFRKQIFPVLTPLAVDPAHPFPYISGLSLNLAVLVRNPKNDKELFARVKVPPLLPRFIAVDSEGRPYRPEDVPADEHGKTTYIPLEEVIGAHLEALFPGMEVVEYSTFRVTRNEDLEVEEDDAENLLKALERELLRRRFGPAVRLEVESDISKRVLQMLTRELGVREENVLHLPAPLDLTGLNVIHDLDRPQLKFKKFVPVTARGIADVETSRTPDIFAAIRRKEILVHHPYESFSTSVQQFIRQAADDPKVLAIKQTLYRTSGDSPIVDALIRAANSGKQVLAVVEIKARFDEENNIEWARKLEQAGVHVVYGIVGLKTHCKLSLVVRQEVDGLRRYVHVGTGNYNPKTARGYEDLGLFTCERDVGQDITRLFNQLSGYAPKAKFHRLLVAPTGIRSGLLDRIEREIDNKLAGKNAWIRFKANSVVDERIIDALYRASQAGVPVDIQVRGICCLRAGIPGLSDSINVRSILGRFLEHSRVYAFCNDGVAEVWIGSADLMHRNLDRRIEALIRIEEPEQIDYLVDMVRRATSDEVQSWRMTADGWVHVTHDAEGNALVNMQEELVASARSTVADHR